MLIGAAAFSVRPTAAARKQELHRFRTADLDVEMTIEFHDGYRSRDLWFREQLSDRRFCLSRGGEEGRECTSNFRGSLAIAQYRVRAHSQHHEAPMLREYVRTIDHDARLDVRPPFERAIKLEKGIGSDLQVFGYDVPPGDEPKPGMHGPWYLFRQDLFLEPQRTPFLVVYWKHTLSSIRALDLIPGDQTWAVRK